MTDLKTLRPYFDRLAEDALVGAQGRTRTPAPLVLASKDESADVIGGEAMVVDLDASRLERTGNRRWLIAAAAVILAVVVVAATLVATESGDHRVRTQRPAGPAPTTAPAPPAPSVVQSPVGRLDAIPLPPEGATPSTPETGELVASISFSRFIDFVDSNRWRDSAIIVYADGHVIQVGGIADGQQATVADAVTEQRITPEGVEQVRSAFLSTGAFDSAQHSTDFAIACACIIRVRDGDRLLSVPTQLTPPKSNIDPQANPNVESLFNFVTHLDSSLSPSAWQDRNIKSYVPSHYRACVYELPGTGVRPVPDLSVALAQHLPAAAAQLLAGSQLIPGFGHCTDLTAADARSVAEGLFNAGIGHTRNVPWPQYQSDVTDGTPPTIVINVEPLLPDGSPLMGPGSLGAPG